MCREEVGQSLQRRVTVICPLCDEQRRYLPSDLCLGRANELAGKQPSMSELDFEPNLKACLLLKHWCCAFLFSNRRMSPS